MAFRRSLDGEEVALHACDVDINCVFDLLICSAYHFAMIVRFLHALTRCAKLEESAYMSALAVYNIVPDRADGACSANVNYCYGAAFCQHV